MAIPAAARAAEPPAVSDADLAAARALFAAGAYDRLQRLLPQLLDGAEHSVGAGLAGATRAAGAWVLASQLAVKQSRTEPAGAYAGLASAAARRCGDAVVLAAAARAGATPLRRTGRTSQALALLQEAHDRLTSASRPTEAELDAAGMVELTVAYTAAQAHEAALARHFEDATDQTTRRLAHRPYDDAHRHLLSAAQCTLYRIGIHRHLADVDTALAHAARLDLRALPTGERRARAATDTARPCSMPATAPEPSTNYADRGCRARRGEPSLGARTDRQGRRRPPQPCGPERPHRPHRTRAQHLGWVERLRPRTVQVICPPRPAPGPRGTPRDYSGRSFPR